MSTLEFSSDCIRSPKELLVSSSKWEQEIPQDFYMGCIFHKILDFSFLLRSYAYGIIWIPQDIQTVQYMNRLDILPVNVQ